MPVARDKIIENMSDGLIVLDSRRRIADMNPAARKIFGNPLRQPIGQEARVLFKDRPELEDLDGDRKNSRKSYLSRTIAV